MLVQRHRCHLQAWLFFSPTDKLSPQAFITKGLVTDTQIISSTFLDRISSAFFTNPGICFKEQVGVNAPGTPTSTTFLPETYSNESISSMPFSPTLKSDALGSFFSNFNHSSLLHLIIYFTSEVFKFLSFLLHSLFLLFFRIISYILRYFHRTKFRATHRTKVSDFS